jgi:hypothetical protein
LHDAHLISEGGSLLSIIVQMLMFLRNTLPDTPGNNVLAIYMDIKEADKIHHQTRSFVLFSQM